MFKFTVPYAQVYDMIAELLGEKADWPSPEWQKEWAKKEVDFIEIDGEIHVTILEKEPTT